MAGFAAFFEANTSPEARDNNFRGLLISTGHYKNLEISDSYATGIGCTAAKLDAPSSLHRGIARDAQSGSWLLAAGTVVALEGNNDPVTVTTCLLRDLLAEGTGALDRYDGHFGLVFYNGREDSLSIISDPMGLFAIYYARRGQQVFISTSALAVARQVESKADSLTIECFLMTDRPIGERTLWEDVKRIPPAIELKITSNGFEEIEYWRPDVDQHISRLTLSEAANLADEKISRIFKLVLSNEHKIWADLTGGFDSRLVTLYLVKLGFPFIAYCVGPNGHPDVEVSRQVSTEMGWEYCHIPLPEGWAEEQLSWLQPALGRGDGLLPIHQLAGVLKTADLRAKTSFTTLTGSGIDEWRKHVLGQNIVIAAALTRIDYDHMLDSKIMYQIPTTVLSKDRTVEVRSLIKEHISNSITGYSGIKIISQIDVAFLRYRHPIHTGAYLSAQAGSTCPISLFCFKELVNFGLSMNHQWRIKYDYRFFRFFIEKENSRLANLPTEDGSPAAVIRLKNFNKFFPLFVTLAGNLIGKTTKKLIGRSWSPLSPKSHPKYPLPEWTGVALRQAAGQNMLNPEKMRSGILYNRTLSELVQQNLRGSYRYIDFLDRVITVEMAMEAAKTDMYE